MKVTTSIIGCDECGEGCKVVELGEELDHDSNTAHICENCLVKALELIRKGE